MSKHTHYKRLKKFPKQDRYRYVPIVINQQFVFINPTKRHTVFEWVFLIAGIATIIEVAFIIYDHFIK